MFKTPTRNYCHTQAFSPASKTHEMLQCVHFLENFGRHNQGIDKWSSRLFIASLIPPCILPLKVLLQRFLRMHLHYTNYTHRVASSGPRRNLCRDSILAAHCWFHLYPDSSWSPLAPCLFFRCMHYQLYLCCWGYALQNNGQQSYWLDRLEKSILTSFLPCTSRV